MLLLSLVVLLISAGSLHDTGVEGFSTTTLHAPLQQQQKRGSAAPSSSSGVNGRRSASAFVRKGKYVHHHVLLATSSSSSSSSDNNYDDICDVLVIGSGAAARAIASLSSAKSFDVILADKNVDREWAPNYGVWKDEWEAIVDRYKSNGIDLKGGNAGNAVDREWQVTDCYFGGSFDIPVKERFRLDRPYSRIDKNALRDSLTPSSSSSSSSENNNKYRIMKANHFSKATGVNIYSPPQSLVHDETGTTIQLETDTGDIQTVRAKLVVDCTGHETELVLKDTRDEYTSPGFQIAYGLLVDIDDDSPGVTSEQIGPYDKEAMTLFDYRTDHYDTSSQANQEKVENAPTFMYAMPLKDNTIFFEETSLVARPAVSFEECKERCYQRLDHLGISVSKVYEEEFCYIPMGGALPIRDQRVVGFGGAAAMVHPSTGYHLCRCLICAADVVNAIEKELKQQSNNSPNNMVDRAAAAAYHAIWSPDNIRQRNFAVFGGEFLMKQNVVGLRGFFDGFFRLPLSQWGGFLAGWPGLPNNESHETWFARMLFGINFIIKLPPQVALDMASNIVMSCVTGTSLLQSVTPIFGEPDSYEYQRNNDRIGDVAAKEEAKRMIQASAVTKELPVAFGDDESDDETVVGARRASAEMDTTSTAAEATTQSSFQ